jgi:hypothetical protein
MRCDPTQALSLRRTLLVVLGCLCFFLTAQAELDVRLGSDYYCCGIAMPSEPWPAAWAAGHACHGSEHEVVCWLTDASATTALLAGILAVFVSTAPTRWLESRLSLVVAATRVVVAVGAVIWVFFATWLATLLPPGRWEHIEAASIFWSLIPLPFVMVLVTTRGVVRGTGWALALAGSISLSMAWGFRVFHLSYCPRHAAARALFVVSAVALVVAGAVLGFGLLDTKRQGARQKAPG